MKKIWKKALIVTSLSMVVAGPTFCDFRRDAANQDIQYKASQINEVEQAKL